MLSDFRFWSLKLHTPFRWPEFSVRSSVVGGEIASASVVLCEKSLKTFGLDRRTRIWELSVGLFCLELLQLAKIVDATFEGLVLTWDKTACMFWHSSPSNWQGGGFTRGDSFLARNVDDIWHVCWLFLSCHLLFCLLFPMLAQKKLCQIPSSCSATFLARKESPFVVCGSGPPSCVQLNLKTVQQQKLLSKTGRCQHIWGEYFVDWLAFWTFDIFWSVWCSTWRVISTRTVWEMGQTWSVKIETCIRKAQST